MDKRLRGGYHLTKTDKVYIGVICKGNKLKFVTSISCHPKEAHWEDGKEAQQFSLSTANEIVMGLCLNGYTAFIADMYYYDKVFNPSAEEE